MSAPVRGALWEAINAYTASCGGDPSSSIYGNTDRMLAVAAVEAAIDLEVAGAVELRDQLIKALGNGLGDLAHQLMDAGGTPTLGELKATAKVSLRQVNPLMAAVYPQGQPDPKEVH